MNASAAEDSFLTKQEHTAKEADDQIDKFRKYKNSSGGKIGV